MDVFVFPGQGSQHAGMGAALFDEVSEFRAVESEVDKLLGYSVREICKEVPAKRLNETVYTQPSLYIVNALHYYKAISMGKRPRLLAGHSLGEYNALLAAGVFDFMTGLRLVQKRGQLMSEVQDGGMAAVVGISAESVTQIIQEGRLVGVDVANFNSRVQTVISGRADELLRARPLFELAGANFVPLAVSAAFHSRFMQSAAETFGLFMNEFSFNAPEIPVISNVTARPYGKNAPSTEVRELLTKQIFSPVQWTHSILYVIGRGGADFQEIGPGHVLTRLIQKILQP